MCCKLCTNYSASKDHVIYFVSSNRSFTSFSLVKLFTGRKSRLDNPTKYKIQGHYYDVTADDVLGIEKSRKDFLPQEKKIANWVGKEHF